MLIAYPVAGYTGTLVGFAVYGANGRQFWLNFAIAMNIASVGGALLAALPGLADLAFGVPRGSAARKVGLAHAGVNIAALALFAVTLGSTPVTGTGRRAARSRGSCSPRSAWV